MACQLVVLALIDDGMSIQNLEFSSSEFARLNRRHVLRQLGSGLGGIALSSMLTDGFSLEARGESQSRIHDVRTKAAQYAPNAKAVIQLFMHGGPSQVDLLDPKPMLAKYHGKQPPAEVADDERRTAQLVQGAFPFRKCGESGLEFADVMPYVAEHADDIAVIRSMYGEHRNHEHSIWHMQTGLIISGRPNIGSWVAYGLGTENQNLPAYVVLPDPKGLPVDGVRNWSSGWLPPVYQGTPFRERGSPVLNLQPKTPRPAGIEKARMELLSKLNAEHKKQHPGELELDARISSFELAARMQLSATEALDVSRETAETHRLYGLDREENQSYGLRCLMARRLIERGVRFVQLFMSGQPWDTHTENASGMRKCCQQTDLPIGGLMADLKRRGLLDSTLIWWGGEFGRTPAADNRSTSPGSEGRDHHPYGFSVWLAGGGIKGGQTYGATDDFGYRAIENRTKVSDLHATILHQLGFDHEALIYRHNGRDERLTDVYEASVIEPLVI